MYIYLSVCLSVYLPVYLSIYLSVCLAVCLSVSLSLSVIVCANYCSYGSIHWQTSLTPGGPDDNMDHFPCLRDCSCGACAAAGWRQSLDTWGPKSLISLINICRIFWWQDASTRPAGAAPWEVLPETGLPATGPTRFTDINLGSSVCPIWDPPLRVKNRRLAARVWATPGRKLQQLQVLPSVHCDSWLHSPTVICICARLRPALNKAKKSCVCVCLVSMPPIYALVTSHHVHSHKRQSSLCALVGLVGAHCGGAWSVFPMFGMCRHP